MLTLSYSYQMWWEQAWLVGPAAYVPVAWRGVVVVVDLGAVLLSVV